MGWSYTHMWKIKIRRDIVEMRGPNSPLGLLAEGSSARK